MFVLVMYFDDFFFVGDFTDDVCVGAVLFQRVHGFIKLCLVNHDAKAPAHVESLEHFLISDRVTQLGSGSLEKLQRLGVGGNGQIGSRCQVRCG